MKTLIFDNKYKFLLRGGCLNETDFLVFVSTCCFALLQQLLLFFQACIFCYETKNNNKVSSNYKCIFLCGWKSTSCSQCIRYFYRYKMCPFYNSNN